MEKYLIFLIILLFINLSYGSTCGRGDGKTCNDIKTPVREINFLPVVAECKNVNIENRNSLCKCAGKLVEIRFDKKDVSKIKERSQSANLKKAFEIVTSNIKEFYLKSINYMHHQKSLGEDNLKPQIKNCQLKNLENLDNHPACENNKTKLQNFYNAIGGKKALETFVKGLGDELHVGLDYKEEPMCFSTSEYMLSNSFLQNEDWNSDIPQLFKSLNKYPSKNLKAFIYNNKNANIVDKLNKNPIFNLVFRDPILFRQMQNRYNKLPKNPTLSDLKGLVNIPPSKMGKSLNRTCKKNLDRLAKLACSNFNPAIISNIGINTSFDHIDKTILSSSLPSNEAINVAQNYCQVQKRSKPFNNLIDESYSELSDKIPAKEKYAQIGLAVMDHTDDFCKQLLTSCEKKKKRESECLTRESIISWFESNCSKENLEEFFADDSFGLDIESNMSELANDGDKTSKFCKSEMVINLYNYKKEMVKLGFENVNGNRLDLNGKIASSGSNYWLKSFIKKGISLPSTPNAESLTTYIKEGNKEKIAEIKKEDPNYTAKEKIVKSNPKIEKKYNAVTKKAITQRQTREQGNIKRYGQNRQFRKNNYEPSQTSSIDKDYQNAQAELEGAKRAHNDIQEYKSMMNEMAKNKSKMNDLKRSLKTKGSVSSDISERLAELERKNRELQRKLDNKINNSSSAIASNTPNNSVADTRFSNFDKPSNIDRRNKPQNKPNNQSSASFNSPSGRQVSTVVNNNRSGINSSLPSIFLPEKLSKGDAEKAILNYDKTKKGLKEVFINLDENLGQELDLEKIMKDVKIKIGEPFIIIGKDKYNQKKSSVLIKPVYNGINFATYIPDENPRNSSLIKRLKIKEYFKKTITSLQGLNNLFNKL